MENNTNSFERVLLYYPSSNIPDGKWLRNSLLYTDKVASILPYELTNPHVSQLTKLLIDEGQFYPVFAEKAVAAYPNDFATLETNFISTIDSRAFEKVKTDEVRFYSPTYGTGFLPNGDYEMFKSKFSYGLLQYLAGKQLLEDREWGEVAVEKNTAAIYFGMLTDYLARTDSQNLVIPCTDQQEFERLAYQTADQTVLTYQLQLNSCLPTPAPDTDLKKIIKFKNQRRDELLEFRKKMDEAEKAIRSAPDHDQRMRELVKFKESIEADLKGIKKLLGESRFDFILNGFKALLDFKQPEIVGTISGLGVGTGTALATTLPIVGLGAGAIVLAATLVANYRKMSRAVESNSSAYIYYAQRELA